MVAQLSGSGPPLLIYIRLRRFCPFLFMILSILWSQGLGSFPLRTLSSMVGSLLTDETHHWPRFHPGTSLSSLYLNDRGPLLLPTQQFITGISWGGRSPRARWSLGITSLFRLGILVWGKSALLVAWPCCGYIPGHFWLSSFCICQSSSNNFSMLALKKIESTCW